jgi:hypothetical protein
MLSKEEMKDVYTRIDNLEADKKSLLSANKKLKENVERDYKPLQKKHLETLKELERLQSVEADKKELLKVISRKNQTLQRRDNRISNLERHVEDLKGRLP